MPNGHIVASVNFNELWWTTCRLISRTTQLAACGLIGAERLRDDDFGQLNIPHAMLQLPPTKRAESVSKATFYRWVIGSALRDAVESISLLLDDIRKICAVGRFVRRGEMLACEWVRDDAAQSDFNKKGVATKLAALKSEFGFEAPSELTNDLFTLIQARNCLVHRLGIVGEMDRKSADALQVTWLGLERRIVNAEDVRVVTRFPVPFEADSKIQIVARRKTRVFPLGASIDFSTNDLTDIGFFLQLYACHLVKSTEKAADFPSGN